MNGRLYDPLLRRFLNADEHIQDAFNTQNYNKYGYVLNNPLMYNDPSGEFIFAAIIAWMVTNAAAIGTAAAIGAAIGLASYTLGVVISGGQWSLGGAFKSMFFGAVGGAVTFGIGSVFSTAAGELTTLANNIKKAVGGVGLAIVQAGTHAVSQGVLGLMQGANFVSAAISGFAGSLGASGWSAVLGNTGASMIAFGALAGGVGAELSGGNFWQGAITGGIVAGLNHAMHKLDPPKGYKGKKWVDDTGSYENNNDGSWNATSPDGKKYTLIEEIELYGKSKLSQNLDNAANGLGINAATKEALFEYAGKTSELSSTASKYLKYTKVLGRVTGIYSAGSSIYDAYRNPTTGNILKATFNTGMLFLRVNPVIGLGIGVLDATGVTNQFFNGVGNFINR